MEIVYMEKEGIANHNLFESANIRLNPRMLFLVIFAYLCVTNTYAYCLNVSPGRIEINVAPRETYSRVITVRNSDNKAIEVKLRVEDWQKAVEGNADLRGEQKRGFTRIGTKKIDTFEWLRLSPLEFGLQEDETKEVKLEVAVPKGAAGELNGMIFIEGRLKEIKEGAIGINTSIGVPIYVVIKGTERFKAEVEDLKVIISSPLQLAITIKNSGNVHIRPTGTIEVINTDAHGLKTDSHGFIVPLNEYNYPILPNSSRTLEIRSNNKLEQGDYMAEIKMGFADRKYKKRITVIIK
jgi:hypothetical protein